MTPAKKPDPPASTPAPSPPTALPDPPAPQAALPSEPSMPWGEVEAIARQLRKELTAVDRIEAAARRAREADDEVERLTRVREQMVAANEKLVEQRAAFVQQWQKDDEQLLDKRTALEDGHLARVRRLQEQEAALQTTLKDLDAEVKKSERGKGAALARVAKEIADRRKDYEDAFATEKAQLEAEMVRLRASRDQLAEAVRASKAAIASLAE